jgi:hypothetical protein
MKKNRGKATCLNRGLKRVQEKYVLETDDGVMNIFRYLKKTE